MKPWVEWAKRTGNYIEVGGPNLWGYQMADANINMARLIIYNRA